MDVVFDSKGDFNNIEKWLNDVARRSPNEALNKIAIEGEESLSGNTPRDTGETADGWQAKITTKKGSAEIAWINTAHPESDINLAVVLDQGYATGTGGFVPPRPYIKSSMDRVFASAGQKIQEELIK